MNYNIIYYENNAYEVITEVAIHNFQNKDKSINQQVLGMYVNDWDANKVLQKDNKFLICKQIEEAQIVE
jgi:hypothetical protein